MENPWNVKNLDEFLYYWCPECDIRDQSKDLFVKHALETHPNSREYVVHLAIKKEQDDVEDEDLASEDFVHEYEAPEEFDTSYMEPKTEIMEDIKCEGENSDDDIACENKVTIKKPSKKSEDGDKHKKPRKLKSRTCDYCGQNFPNKMDLNRHKKEFHKDIKEHKCDSCNKGFTMKADLKKHIRVVHEKIRNHVCNHCGKAFGTLNCLQKHIRYVHDGEKDANCELCGKNFRGKFSLQKHKESVHEGQKNYTCHLCGKAFTQPGTVKAHINSVHEGIRDFRCELCGKEYEISYLFLGVPSCLYFYF